MEKQRFIFLGGIFNDVNMVENIKRDSKGNIQYAADIFQKALLDGMYEFIDKENLDLINIPFVGGFPLHYKKPIFVYNNNNNKVYLNNFMYIKNLSREKLAYKLLKNSILRKESVKYTIFVYSLHSPFLDAVLKIKKNFPNKNIEIVSIVPDLPEFMNLGKSTNYFFNLLKTIDMKKIYKNTPHIDYFIVLTEAIAIKLGTKNFTVVEGIYKQDEVNDVYKKVYKTNTILYTGTIDKKYGIINLVNAFKNLTTDFKLVIYGEGDSREEILKISKQNPSIIYKGLADHDVVVREQKKAKFLINPRNPNEEYTKYSFPSKIMEYMASGTPVITSKLQGIPDEYFDFLITIDTDNDESFKTTLNNILNQDYSNFETKGESARKFVLEKKNSKVQIQKILKMLGI